ncbi:MAG: UvrD-helicase domain-containing protein [Planctomycetota bacterium]|nr:UvrD-helicase domain-containing protein [Planctomycetota bacterium]MDA1114662.1 UvrD-helicase domain-containing protein [Planctomycetota bacterium]
MSTLDLLSGLNPAQQQAVEYVDGPMLILAGAGTGKTRTITRRVAHLVQVRGVPASRILAITFTNKAAGEMRQRIGAYVPHMGMWVGTFHATCARMLRMNPQPIGRSRDFTIVDVEDRRKLLRQLIKDQGWDPQVFRPRKFESMISGWKQHRLSPANAQEQASMYGMEEERCALVYGKYEIILGRTDCLDFDDLLWKGLQLIEKDRSGARMWTERFDHIVVDEYQDTNEVQYEMVKALAAHSRNLAVCGDPDQSIYRWRGADISNILSFDKDYPDAVVVRLEQNYRSVGNVLKAAQFVIKNNTSRKEKDLVTDREDGPPLGLSEGQDEELEANQVAMRVAAWIRGGTTAKEVAVFYRTNSCSRSLEAAFTRLQIPYQIVGGLSFFERREIKDLIAFARLAVNPCDDIALQRVINVPPRGIGAKSLDRLRAIAAEHEEPMLTTLQREEVRSGVRGPAKKGIMKFLSLYDAIRQRMDKAEFALRAILDRSGYRHFAEALDHTEDVDRGQNIDELLAFANEYDQREEGGLRGFLEEISLLTDTNRWQEEAERVSLMTVHAAKGLEFDRVAVVGLEEGLFPHARSFEDPEGLEEERRLFYVALTRAREELLLSHCRMRFRTGAPGPTTPSRFLQELPDSVLPDFGTTITSPSTACNNAYGGTEEVSCLPNFAQPKRGSFHSTVAQPVPDVEEAEGLVVGDLVTHPVFGDGNIKRIQGKGVNARVVVEFDESGDERTLLLSYSMLEKLT